MLIPCNVPTHHQDRSPYIDNLKNKQTNTITITTNAYHGIVLSELMSCHVQEAEALGEYRYVV